MLTKMEMAKLTTNSLWILSPKSTPLYDSIMLYFNKYSFPYNCQHILFLFNFHSFADMNSF